jgi:hypothetical protein
VLLVAKGAPRFVALPSRGALLADSCHEAQRATDAIALPKVLVCDCAL